MNRMRGLLLGGIALLSAASGCLSVAGRLDEQAEQVTHGVLEKAYNRAAALAEEDSADTGFWQAEAGTLALMRGKPKDAIHFLGLADESFNDLARRRYGASAVDTTAALAVNDCTMPYAAEGLDRVFTHIYRALAYGVSNDMEAMRVELNRARQRQIEWFGQCSEDIVKQEDALKQLSKKERQAVRQAVNQQTAPTPLAAGIAETVSAEGAEAIQAFSTLRGFGNPYAAHLTGVFRWCMGDAPRNDLAMAAALAPTCSAVQADALASAAGRVPQKRVWVYIEDGLAPRRTEHPFTIPYPSLTGNGFGTLTFNVPKLEPRAAAATSYTVNHMPCEQLTDVDALAQDQFDRAWPGILTRQVTRTILRVAMQEGTQAAVKTHRDGGEAAALLISAAWIVYNAATNAADVRCADLLPKKVWLAALSRPADGTLQVRSADGQEIRIQLHPQGNALVWVRRAAATGQITVLTVDLERPAGYTTI